MHDFFPSIWKDKIAALPCVATLALPIAPNVDAELLTCIVCNRGEGRAGEVPEWLLTMRNPNERKTVGLHERCRERSQLKAKEAM